MISRLHQWLFAPAPPLRHDGLPAAQMAELLDGTLKGLGLRHPRLEAARLAGRKKFPWSSLADTAANREAIWQHYASAMAAEPSSWVRQILARFAKDPGWARLENHVNRGQVSSKLWLLEEVEKVRPELGNVLVLGGWYGALAALLHEHPGLKVKKVTNMDLDSEAVAVSLELQAPLVKEGKYEAVCRDMVELRLEDSERPDTLINTSCEHLPDFGAWYDRVPAGTFLVLQSNDYFAEPEHCNCVPDLDAFRKQAPLARELFAGERMAPHGKYRRFMLMGVK